MARIVLIIKSKENRYLLNSFLSAYHSIGEHAPGSPFEEAFDLCIIDDANLSRLKKEIEASYKSPAAAILFASERGMSPRMTIFGPGRRWCRSIRN